MGQVSVVGVVILTPILTRMKKHDRVVGTDRLL